MNPLSTACLYFALTCLIPWLGHMLERELDAWTQRKREKILRENP